MHEGFGLFSKDSNTLSLYLSLLIKVDFSIKKRALALSKINFKKRDNPHFPAFCKILALHMVFASYKNNLLMGLFVFN